MATLKDEALVYEGPQTENIANLDKIPVNLELKEDEGTNKANEKFKYKYVEIQGKKYRVPGTVLGGIKAVLNKYPETQYVTVDKSGEGKTQTRYNVMPYVEQQETKTETIQ